MKIKKFSFGNVSDILSGSELKRVIGGYDVGNTCWHYCKTYDGEWTASVWGTCYVAYHECNRRGELAVCYCNG